MQGSLMSPVKLKSLNPGQHHLLERLTPLPTGLSIPAVCVCVYVRETRLSSQLGLY